MWTFFQFTTLLNLAPIHRSIRILFLVKCLCAVPSKMEYHTMVWNIDTATQACKSLIKKKNGYGLLSFSFLFNDHNGDKTGLTL